MKNFLRILICLGLAGFAAARAVSPASKVATTAKAVEKKPSGQKANAKTLLADSRKALAAMVKAARADKGLDPATAKNKPFWKSTHLIAQNLQKAEKGMAAKNDDFFKGIAAARVAEQQMKIDWQLTDSKNKAVIDNGKKLGHALALLRTDFSKEAARKKKGGELTKDEKAKFAKIKAQQKELLAKTKKLEKVTKKDKALEKGLHKIRAQAAHTLKEPDTVDAFIATLYLLDEQIGLIRGYEYYVDKNWRADYLVLVTFTDTYLTSYDAWISTVSYEWSSIDESVDVYTDEAVDVSDSISDEEMASEENYAESESFDMSDDEQDEVAMEEDTDAEVDADNAADEDSMDDASDDEGEDMSEDGGDEGGGDEDMGDDGGDDGGGDDGGGDEGE